MEKKYNLTRAQMGILFSFDENGNIVLTNKNFIWGHARINQEIDFGRLKEAINYCFKKNDSLRIKLCSEDNKLLQYFEKYEKLDIEIVDVNNQDEVKQLEDEIINRPFNMFDSLLFHVVIYRYKNGFGGIIIKLNHVIADGYTIGLIVYEVLGYYSKTFNKYISFSYTDYIHSEEDYPSSRRYELDKGYWNEMFKNGIPESAYFPTNKKKYSMVKANKLIFDIDNSVIKKVKEFCNINKISICTFFMSIYAIYIYKVTKLKYFFLSNVTHNRRNIKEKLTTGMFSNTAYFDVKIHNEKYTDFIKEINSSLNSGYKHMDYINNYAKELFEQYNDDRILPTNITISYQNVSLDTDKMNINFEITGDSNVGTYGSDIVIIHVVENNDSFEITYDYLSEKYSTDDIKKINTGIINIIKQVCNDKNMYIEDITI